MLDSLSGAWQALAEADAIDARALAGESVTPLCGLPLAVTAPCLACRLVVGCFSSCEGSCIPDAQARLCAFCAAQANVIIA